MSTNGDTETTVKLLRPLKTIEGQMETISIDIDQLTMESLHNLEAEYQALWPNTMPTNGIYLTDTKYQSLMIARINGITYDILKQLGARDTFNISNRLGRFLIVPA